MKLIEEMVDLVAQERIKPLFLFVGRSASGKTTIANMLESDGYSQISSYTTRPPRSENEKGHIFITDEEYEKLENIMAFTLYNGYKYCTTLEQVKNADIYVVDVDGVSTLLDNYNLINRDIEIIYFDSTVYTRIQRMLSRGDSDTQIISRLLTDEKSNWVKDLLDANYNHDIKAKLHTIDANHTMQAVYTNIKNLIEKRTKK